MWHVPLQHAALQRNVQEIQTKLLLDIAATINKWMNSHIQLLKISNARNLNWQTLRFCAESSHSNPCAFLHFKWIEKYQRFGATRTLFNPCAFLHFKWIDKYRWFSATSSLSILILKFLVSLAASAALLGLYVKVNGCLRKWNESSLTQIAIC